MQNWRRYRVHETFIFFQNEKSHALNYANSCNQCFCVYAHACTLKGAQCFQLRISLPEVTGHLTSSTPVDLNALLEDYHNFADVFSKSKAGKLAEHQPYNLKITLDEVTVPLFGPIYSLSQEELAALCKFIDEILATGFICPSCSPCGALVLFIQKKDSSLQLCVNFWDLNRISKKDQYPLPLISDLLDAPQKAQVYTKITAICKYLLPFANNFRLRRALWFCVRWPSTSSNCFSTTNAHFYIVLNF